MKKLVGILVLGLLWCNAVASDDIKTIKIKRIECLNKNYDDIKEENYFFIVSKDNKTAKMFKLIDGSLLNESIRVLILDLNVYADMYTVEFRTHKTNNYIIDRQTGYLRIKKKNWTNQYHMGECKEFDENFNPEEYLSKIVKERVKKIKKKSKF